MHDVLTSPPETVTHRTIFAHELHHMTPSEKIVAKEAYKVGIRSQEQYKQLEATHNSQEAKNEKTIDKWLENI